MNPGDLQFCPWCQFSGTPRAFDVHYSEMHERNSSDDRILAEVYAERRRQDKKWGEQNHPDGTGTSWVLDGGPDPEDACKIYRKITDKATDQGKLTFRDIALEEIAEAFAETDPELVRAELVQCCAVLVNWIGAIDRRRKTENDARGNLGLVHPERSGNGGA